MPPHAACYFSTGSPRGQTNLPPSLSASRPASQILAFSSSVGSLSGRANAKAHELGVGVVPHALRELRVLLFPIFARSPAGGAAQRLGIVVPRAAANRVRIQGFGDGQRLDRRFSLELRIVIGNVLIEHHSATLPCMSYKAPRIRLLLADLFVAFARCFRSTRRSRPASPDRRRTNRPFWCRRGRRIPIRLRSAGGSSGRSWRSASGSTCWRRSASCRWPESRPCPCRTSCRCRAWSAGSRHRPVCRSPSVFSFSTLRRSMSRVNMKISNSSQVTSHLPIQNGSICTSCCGPSSALCPFSVAGLPMVNLPPGWAACRTSLRCCRSRRCRASSRRRSWPFELGTSTTG